MFEIEPPRHLRTVKFQLSCNYRIMHSQLSDKILDEYSQTGQLPKHIRPNRCKFCNEKQGFHRHSHYKRKCIFRKSIGWLPVTLIQRFKCRTCGRVFSLLFSTTYKWQRAEHIVQQEVMSEGFTESTTIKENFSQRTIYRWKAKWNAWAAQTMPYILQWLMNAIVFLCINVTQYEARKPIHYLTTLLTRMPKKMPVAIEVVGISHFAVGSPGKIPQSLSLSYPLTALV